MSDTDILGRRPRLRDGLVAEHTGHGSPFISNSDKRAARFTATASQERLKEAAVVVCGAGGLGGCHSGVDMHHGRAVPADGVVPRGCCCGRWRWWGRLCRWRESLGRSPQIS